MAEPRERRECKRIPAKLIANLRKVIAETGNSPEEVSTGNICAEGLFLETKMSLVEGDLVEFDLKLPDAGETIAVVGIVRWCQHSAPEGIGVELAVTATAGRELLTRYIEQLHEEEGAEP